MRRRGTRDIILLIILLGAGIGGTVYAIFGPQLLQTKPKVEPYQTVNVQRGNINSIVGATGSAQARQSVALAWKVTGTVETVNIKPGDHVQPGQQLAALQQSSVPANLILAYFDLLDARKSLDNMLNSQSQQTKAEQDVVNAQKALDDALHAQELLKVPNASPSVIELAQGNLDKADAAVNQAEQIYSMFEGRTEQDVQRLQAAANLERARRMRDYAEINLQYAKNKPDPQTAQRVNADVDVAQAKLKDAQRTLEKVKNGPNPDDIKTLQVRIDADNSTIALAYLVSPLNGTVTQANIKAGDSAQPGKTVILVEDISEMHVQVPVQEVDISKIKVGQKASMVFDAIQDRTYQGEVIDVAKVGSTRQGNVYFDVEVRISNSDESVKTGMTAAVNIVTQEVKDVLLVPNRAVRAFQNQPVVYVLRGDQAVQVPVVLGASDDINSQVVSGDLKAGDKLVLNPIQSTPAR